MTTPVLPITDEPEILNGMRAFDKAQELLRGPIDSSQPSFEATVGWYDSEVSPYEGCLAMVAAGGSLTDLVGDTLLVRYGDTAIYAYVVGAATLPNDLCLARQAFIRLERLSQEEILISGRVTA